MRAMILAAGRGERMGELTRTTPKPLLKIGQHYLIEYAIYNLLRAGIKEIVINISYQAEQIKQALGDGKNYGAKFFYSEEIELLNTGGGILNALPLLGHEPFLVVSADIVTDFPLQQLLKNFTGSAHLLMVDNPHYHPQGDFALREGRIYLDSASTFTFASVGVYHPNLFTHCTAQKFPLTTVLTPAILAGQVTGEHYRGLWYNVGTADDLREINSHADLMKVVMPA